MAGFQSLRVPYHPPREGWWGEKTSTLNFCEEVLESRCFTPPAVGNTANECQDYVMSYYVAEVCNVSCTAVRCIGPGADRRFL